MIDKDHLIKRLDIELKRLKRDFKPGKKPFDNARQYSEYYEKKSKMKKYEILLDRKFIVFITAGSEEEAKQKAKKLYGGEAEAIEE